MFHLINGAAAEGQGREKMIDRRLLVTAEKEPERGVFGCFFTSRMGRNPCLYT